VEERADAPEGRRSTGSQIEACFYARPIRLPGGE